MSIRTVFAAIAISLVISILLYLLAASIRSYEKLRAALRTKNNFIEKWNDALTRKDRQELENILNENMASCTVKNTYCGTEIFCPDCPYGGLVVMSGRYRTRKEKTDD